MRAYDLTGQRFGKLVAIERKGKADGMPGNYWVCLCDCGNTTLVNTSNLTSGHTKSCGCSKTTAQKDATARMAAQKGSPLTSKHELNKHAKCFRLERDGEVHDIRNLTNFVRENKSLFDLDETADENEINKVSRQMSDASYRGYRCRGWAVEKIPDTYDLPGRKRQALDDDTRRGRVLSRSKAIGSVFCDARFAKGLQKTDIAAMTGISKASIERYEVDPRLLLNAPAKNFFAVCVALGLDPNELYRVLLDKNTTKEGKQDG